MPLNMQYDIAHPFIHSFLIIGIFPFMESVTACKQNMHL